MACMRKIFTRAKIILDLEQTLNVRVAAESGWTFRGAELYAAVYGL